MTRTLHILVSGKVQGVYFRAFAQEQAASLKLGGLARNVSDGKVEILAQGADDALEEFRARLRRGSPLSRVEHVEARWIDWEEEFPDFHIQ